MVSIFRPRILLRSAMSVKIFSFVTLEIPRLETCTPLFLLNDQCTFFFWNISQKKLSFEVRDERIDVSHSKNPFYPHGSLQSTVQGFAILPKNSLEFRDERINFLVFHSKVPSVWTYYLFLCFRKYSCFLSIFPRKSIKFRGERKIFCFLHNQDFPVLTNINTDFSPDY